MHVNVIDKRRVSFSKSQMSMGYDVDVTADEGDQMAPELSGVVGMVLF